MSATPTARRLHSGSIARLQRAFDDWRVLTLPHSLGVEWNGRSGAAVSRRSVSGGSSAIVAMQSAHTFTAFDVASRVADFTPEIDQQELRSCFGGASIDAPNDVATNSDNVITLMSPQARFLATSQEGRNPVDLTNPATEIPMS